MKRGGTVAVVALLLAALWASRPPREIPAAASPPAPTALATKPAEPLPAPPAPPPPLPRLLGGDHGFVHRYGPDGVEFSREGRSLGVSLLDIRRGERPLLNADLLARVEPAREGRDVHYARGPVRETYRGLDYAVEQLFTLDASLAEVPGDLTIRVSLRTPPGTSIQATQAGLRVVDDQGGLAFSYGNATAVDAAGRTRGLAYQMDGDELLMTLDDAFLASARFPLVIDPLIGFSDSFSPIFSARVRSDMAFGAGVYLLAQELDQNGPQGDLYLALYNPTHAINANLGDPANDARAPRVARGGASDFLVVWQERIGTGPWSLKARRIATTPTTITLVGTEITLGAGLRPDVGYIPDLNVWLVAWETNGDIFGATVAADGSVGAPFALAATAAVEESPSVTSGLSNPAGVAWVQRASAGTQGDIHTRSVDAAGPSTGPISILSAHPSDESDPHLGGSGPSFAAWSRAAASGASDVLARRVTFGPGAPVLGIEFAPDATGTHALSGRIDAATLGADARAVVILTSAPSYPPTPNAFDLQARVYDTAVDPPALLETLSLGTDPNQNERAPAVAVDPATLTSMAVWSKEHDDVSFPNGSTTYTQRMVLHAVPTLAVTPATLTFAGVVGGFNPSSQSITAQNIGGGTLNWSATESIPWLSLAPASGSAGPGISSGTSAQVNLAGLTAGSYSGLVTLSDPAALGSPKTVTVNLHVLEITWSSAPSGSYASGQPIPMSWTVAAGTAILAHNDVLISTTNPPPTFPEGVSNQPGGSGTYSATIDAPLSPNTYRIRIHGYLTGGPEVFSPVATFSVTPAVSPILGLSVSSLSFTPDSTSANLTLSNPGTGTLTWSAAPSAPWIQVDLSSGSRPAGTSQPLAVSVNPAGLPVGLNSGTISFTAPGAINSPKILPISLLVPGTAWVTPPAPSYVSGAPISVSWSAQGVGTCSTSVRYDTVSVPWSGTGVGHASGPAGTYSTTFAAPSVTTPTTYYFGPHAFFSSVSRGPVVSSVILPRPALALDRTALSFSASAGVDPSPQSVTLRNSGGGSLSWTAVDGAAWLGVGPPGGSLGPGATTTLTVTTSVAGLPPGTYASEILVTDPSASNSPQRISVSLSVSAVTWTSPPVGPYVSGDPIPVGWSVDAGTWLSTSNRVHHGPSTPLAGSPSGLDQPGPSGLYADTLIAPVVSAPTTWRFQAIATVAGVGHGSPVASVTINPAPAPILGLDLSEARFVTALGISSPPTRALHVINRGSGTLGWSAASGAGWLSTSPAAGSLPADGSEKLTLSLNLAGLAAGVHTTSLTVSAPGAAGSPKILPVTLTLVSLSWVTPPPAAAVSGDPLSFTWSLSLGAATATGNEVRSGFYTPPLNSSTSTGNHPGASGNYSDSLPAPSVYSSTAAYYLQPRAVVEGVIVAGPIATTLVSPPTIPAIGLASTSLSFSANPGTATPSPQYVQISNTGGGTLSWTASSPETWLSETSSGSVYPQSPQYIYINVNPTGLAPGVYTGTVTVNAAGATNTPQTITVTFTVAARPPNDNFANRTVIAGSALTVAGSSINATAEAGEPNAPTYRSVWWSWTAPSSGTFSVNTIGSGFDTELYIYTGAAVGALTQVAFSDDIFSPAYSSWSQVALAATAGTTYQIRVGDAFGEGAITLSISAGPRILLGASTASAVVAKGGANPISTVTSIRNTGTGNLAWTAASSQPWLRVSPAAGALAATQGQSLTLAVESAGLAGGVHTAIVSVTDPGATNSPQTFTYTLTVLEVAWITPPRSGYAYQQPIDLAWSVQAGAETFTQNRVRFGTSNPPAGGWTDHPGGSGIYTDNIPAPFVSVPTPYYFAVEIVVGAVSARSPVVEVLLLPERPTMETTETSMTFAAPQGGPSPAPRNLGLRSQYGRPLVWTVTTDVPWLGVSPASGSLGSVPMTASIDISPNVTGLAAGTYVGNLRFSDPNALNTPLLVPVTLIVPSLTWISPPSGSYVSGAPIDLTWSVSMGTSLSEHNSIHYGPTNPPLAFSSASQPGASGFYRTSILAPTVAAPTVHYFRPHLHVADVDIPGPIVSTTITPSGGPVLALASSQLTFSAIEAGPNPASQAVEVRNDGAGTMTWSAAESTSWLSLSPGAGNLAAGASEPLTVTIDATGLSAGTYAVPVTVSAGGALRALAVVLTVRRPGVIELSPTSLAFTGVPDGKHTISKSVRLSNIGGERLLGTYSSNQTWLTIWGSTFNVYPGSSSDFSVSVNPAGLAPGVHVGTLTFSDPAAANSPATLTVTLTLQAPGPLLELSRTAIAVTTYAGSSPWLDYVNLGNVGSASMSWGARDDASWLSMPTASGVLFPGSVYQFSPQVDASGLTPGVHTGTIRFEAPGALNSPTDLVITLTVRPALPEISLTPASLAFRAAQGGPAPPSQTLSLFNVGGAGPLTWTAVDNAPWLSVSPASGSNVSYDWKKLQVAVNPTGLAPGSYAGSITFSSPTASNSPQIVPVAFTVTPPGPILEVSADTLKFRSVVGLGALPQAITVTNRGSAALNWSAAASASWLSPSPGSGNLPPGESAMLELRVDPAGLPSAIHETSLLVSAAGAVDSPRLVRVTLELADIAWVTPPAASCTSGQMISMTYNLTGTADSYGTHWLEVDTTNPPSAGYGGMQGQPGLNTRQFTAPSVTAPTTYYVRIRYQAYPESVSLPAVPILVSPAGASPWLGYPNSLIFQAAQGGANPVSQSVTLNNGGTGPMSWTAGSAEPWLFESPASGTIGPGSCSISVAVDIAGLAPGTYNGTVSIAVPGALNSPLSIPVKLTVSSIIWVTPPPATATTGDTLTVAWRVDPPLQTYSGSEIRHGLTNPPGSSETGAAGSSGTYSARVVAPEVSVVSPYFFQPEQAGLLGPLAVVTLSPAAGPVLILNKDELIYSADAGGPNPPSQEVRLRNALAGPLGWSASSSQPWIGLSPASGTLTSASGHPVSITVDVSSLAPGTHTGTLSFSAPGAINSPKTLLVRVYVSEPGVPPPNDDFAARTPLAGSNVVATGTNVHATFETGEPAAADPRTVWWAWTAPSSGTFAASTFGSSFDTTLAVYTGGALGALVQVAANDNAPGTGESHLTFAATAGVAYAIRVNSSYEVTGSIRLSIANAPQAMFSPAQTSVNLLQGASPLYVLTPSLRNAGTSDLAWTATDDAAWLTVGPTSGVLAAGASQALTLSIDATGLVPGPYVSTVTVNGTPFTLNLAVVGLAWVTPPKPFYTVGETGTIRWEVLGGPSTLGGTRVHYSPMNPPPPDFVTAAHYLSTGIVEETFTVQYPWQTGTYYFMPHYISNNGQSMTGPVVSTVFRSSPPLEATPAGLSFAATQNGPAPPAQTLTLSYGDPGSIYWTAVSDAPWLGISPDEGSFAGSTPLSVTVNPAGLAPGTYPATIRIRSAAFPGYVLDVPVTFALTADVLPPTILSVGSTSPDGAYAAGLSVNLTLTFSEPVVLAGGSLLLDLDSGATLAIPPFGPSTTVSATYTVAPGNSSPALDALNPLTLGASATLRDLAGNNAVLTIPAGQNLSDSRSIAVDGVPPLVNLAGPGFTTFAPIATLEGTASDDQAGLQVTWVNAATGQSGTAAGTSPWSALIPLAVGPNAITVTATDVAGNMATAATTVTRTADAVAPAGTIAGPASTAVPTAAVTGTATDNVAVTRVTWLNEATGESGLATGLPDWSASIPLKPGRNVLRAFLWDAAGNVTVLTLAVDFTPADMTPPTLAITPPAPAVATPAPLSGTATDTSGIASVTWRNETTGVEGAATGASPWNALIPLTAGANLIQVTARDSVGNVTSATATMTLTPPADLVPPLLAILTPAAPTAFSSPLTVGGTASDATGISSVTWSNAATGGEGTAAGTTSWSAVVGLAAGLNSITVTAWDPAGNAAAETILVTFIPPAGDGVPPVLLLLRPATGSFGTSSASERLEGIAADDQGLAAVVWANATAGTAGAADGLGSWSAGIGLVPGPNALTLTAIDTAGHTTTLSLTVTLGGGGGGVVAAGAAAAPSASTSSGPLASSS